MALSESFPETAFAHLGIEFLSTRSILLNVRWMLQFLNHFSEKYSVSTGFSVLVQCASHEGFQVAGVFRDTLSVQKPERDVNARSPGHLQALPVKLRSGTFSKLYLYR